MNFGTALHYVIDRIISTGPALRPNFMRKFDLADTCIRIWVQLADVTAVSLLVTRKKESDLKLVVFHLSIPMGYIESAPLFCMETKRMKELSLNSLHERGAALEHSLETLAEIFPLKRDAHWEGQEGKVDNNWRKATHSRNMGGAHAHRGLPERLHSSHLWCASRVNPDDSSPITLH